MPRGCNDSGASWCEPRPSARLQREEGRVPLQQHFPQIRCCISGAGMCNTHDLKNLNNFFTA